MSLLNRSVTADLSNPSPTLSIRAAVIAQIIEVARQQGKLARQLYKPLWAANSSHAA